MPVIGVLYGVAAVRWTDNMAAFRRGLGDTGFVEGRNVAANLVGQTVRWIGYLPWRPIS